MPLFMDKSIEEIRSAVLSKQIGIEDLMDECIAVSNHNEIWDEFSEDIVRKNYKKLLGGDLSKECLYGIPFGVEEIINTEDYHTWMGKNQLSKIEAGNDARVVFNMKYQGGVVVGKAHNINYAVLKGAVPFTIGIQSRDFIVSQSMQCGLFGFKPSFGLIPRTGMYVEVNSVDTVGFLTSNAWNLRIIFEQIRVKGLDYPFVHKYLESDQYWRKKNEYWKIAVAEMDSRIEENVIETFNKWIEEIHDNSFCKVDSVAIRDLTRKSNDTYRIISYKEESRKIAEKTLSENQLKKYEDILRVAKDISSEEYVSSLEQQNTLIDEVNNYFSTYDIMIVGPYCSKDNVEDVNSVCIAATLLNLPIVYMPLVCMNDQSVGILLLTRKYSDYILIEFIEELLKLQMIEVSTFKLWERDSL